MGVLKIDKKLQDQLFQEIQDSLSAELNYEIGAQNLEVFKTFHEQLDDQVIFQPCINNILPDGYFHPKVWNRANPLKPQAHGRLKPATRLAAA